MVIVRRQVMLGDKLLRAGLISEEQLKDIDIPTIILDTDRGYPAEYFYLDNGFEPSDSSIILYGDTSK